MDGLGSFKTFLNIQPGSNGVAHKKYVHGLVTDFRDKVIMQFLPAKKIMVKL